MSAESSPYATFMREMGLIRAQHDLIGAAVAVVAEWRIRGDHGIDVKHERALTDAVDAFLGQGHLRP